MCARSTFWDFNFTTRWTEKGRFPELQPLLKNQNFGAGVTKNVTNAKLQCLPKLSPKNTNISQTTGAELLLF